MEQRKMGLSKNQIVEITIEDVGINGEGIGRKDGIPLFVKNAVIGDRILAGVTKVKKNYVYARVEKLLEPSPWRVEPKCPAAGKCGGCQLQNYTYEKQLEIKQNKVFNNLRRIGGFPEEEITGIIQPVIGMDSPYFYRNKAQYPVGKDREGNPVTGFYAFHSHRIIECEACCLNHKGMEQISQLVLAYMKMNQVSSYDEETGKGTLRHILVRHGAVSGEWMVCLVINGTPRKKAALLPGIDGLIEQLKSIPGMVSISVCYNTENTNVIMGDTYDVLWGADGIHDYIGNVEFEISPLSFYQVNPVQTEKLYGKALEYALPDGGKLQENYTVWDLYCGIGTISLFLAQKLAEKSENSENAGKVYGVEIIPQAIENARANAKKNKITNAEFYVGKAEEVLPRLYKDKGIQADVIVVDPPRKGCEPEVLDTMLKMAPKRIVYVSCDSATLARDLKILSDGNGEYRYKLQKVQPVDMFPQTVHVETVVLMSRVK